MVPHFLLYRFFYDHLKLCTKNEKWIEQAKINMKHTRDKGKRDEEIQNDSEKVIENDSKRTTHRMGEKEITI